MKKQNRIATLVVAALAAFSLTFIFAGDIAVRAGGIKDAVLNKLLYLTAKQVITPKFIAEALKNRKSNFGGNGPVNFHDAYYQARSTTYYSTFWGEDHPDMHEKASTDDNYYALRTVVVAQMKEQLNSGTVLMDLYKSCRKDWMAALPNEGVEFQQSLLESVERAAQVFEKIKNSEFRKELRALEVQERRESYGFDETKIADMLSKHAKAEEIVKQIQHQQSATGDTKKVEVSVDKTRDRDLERFAFRRYEQGGEKLTKKYHDVAVLAAEDIKKTIVNTIIR